MLKNQPSYILLQPISNNNTPSKIDNLLGTKQVINGVENRYIVYILIFIIIFISIIVVFRAFK
jgi:hypothetical protein